MTAGAAPVARPRRRRQDNRRKQEETERVRITRCLQRNYWSMSRAAQELGIHRSTLWRKTKQLGIQRP